MASSSSSTSFVFSWGCGEHGQLGHGDTAGRLCPALVSGVAPTGACAAGDVCWVAAGGSRSAVVTTDGRVFVFGGKTEADPGNHRPRQIVELQGHKIDQVACGALHMVALDKTTNSVFQWGNICGKHVLPSVIPQLSKVTINQVVACGAFTIAVSDEGSAFSWGCNSRGQLGLGDSKDRESPQQVKFASHVTVAKACCGGQHTLFLSADLSVYSCGFNKYGQLGLGDTVDRTTPQLIEGLPQIAHLGCGDNHSLFASTSAMTPNTVFTCGRKAQCGIDVESGHILKPVPLNSINATLKAENDWVVSLAGSGAFNASHSLLLSAKGKVYAFGNSKYGQCGVYGSSEVASPTPVEALATTQVTQVACGWMHSISLTKPSATGSTKQGPTLLNHFGSLPTTVSAHIMSYLSLQDLCHMSLVNSAVRQIANDDSVWLSLYVRHVGPPVMDPSYQSWENAMLQDTRNPVHQLALSFQPSSFSPLPTSTHTDADLEQQCQRHRVPVEDPLSKEEILTLRYCTGEAQGRRGRYLLAEVFQGVPAWQDGLARSDVGP
eukprot:TRINITY_DN1977_c0_g1_i3.p1 TRINITY_DN1977_c0_g1~~TRINITY_DN1977_c0_g1_i3.p1  ORF type:complete len:585 (+),score=67.20 TRINITY_DN1977_c0_g1_i3:111-1757(+)